MPSYFPYVLIILSVLNRSGVRGHGCIPPDLKTTSFSRFSIECVHCRLLTFIVQRTISSTPMVLRGFNHDRALIWVHAFSVSTKKITQFLSFILLMCIITYIGLCGLDLLQGSPCLSFMPAPCLYFMNVPPACPLLVPDACPLSFSD